MTSSDMAPVISSGWPINYKVEIHESKNQIFSDMSIRHSLEYAYPGST